MSKKIYYYEDGVDNDLFTQEYEDFRDFFSKDLIITGNKRLCGFNESWLDSDFSIRDFNAKDFNGYFTNLTGKEWDTEVYCMSGISQGDWQYVIYNKNALDLSLIKYLEGIYFGTFSTINVEDEEEGEYYSMVIKDLETDTLTKAIGTSDYELYKYVLKPTYEAIRVN